MLKQELVILLTKKTMYEEKTGMKISGQLRFIVINKQANSLSSLIADGTYRATSLGRNEWKKLIGAQGSLQLYCNKEGFNAVGTASYRSKARIGYIANQENYCGSCDWKN